MPAGYRPGIILKTLGIAAVGLLALLLLRWALELFPGLNFIARLTIPLLVVYPPAAALIGAAAYRLDLSLWPALVAALLVFVVALAAWFNEADLAYLPIYLALSAAGFAAARVFWRKRQDQ